MAKAAAKTTSQKGTDLFDHANREVREREQPLAARMRPRTLDEFVGQSEILGPGKLLINAEIVS